MAIRRPTDICLLCRYSAPLKSFGIARRTGSSNSQTARNSQLHPAGLDYVATPLLVDLDAADSKYVRKWEDEPLPERKKKVSWQSQLAKQRKELEQRQLELRARRLGTAVMDWRAMPGLELIQPTVPDLLAFALLGNPFSAKFPQSTHLRTLYKRKRIQAHETLDTTVRLLTSNFTINASEVLIQAGFTDETKEIIRTQIRTCPSFPNLHRLITMLSSTPEGCRFLVSSDQDIITSIRLCRRARHQPSLTDIVLLLNDLQLNLKSKGIAMGAALCNLGIYYSSKLGHIPALKTYLESAVENRYITNTNTANSLQALISQKSFVKDWASWLTRDKRKEAILKLLVGWESGGVPSNGEIRKPCYSSLLAHDPFTSIEHSLLPRYLFALGHLGFTEAIWYEWNNLDDSSLPAGFRGPEHAEARASMFAIALVAGKDSKRALEVLSTIPKIPTNTSNLTPTSEGQSPLEVIFPADIQSGHRTIMQRLIFQVYYSRRLYPTVRLITEVDKGVPTDPQLALETLEWLLDYGDRSEETRVAGLDWGERDDGSVGPVVRFLADNYRLDQKVLVLNQNKHGGL